MSWVDALPENRRRGSFPRCLLFLNGDRAVVAGRLTKLVGLRDVQVRASDFWMPQGLPVLDADGNWDKNPIEEAKLLDEVGESRRFLFAKDRKKLTEWWLAGEARNNPNWDIASTCTIEGTPGLLLVEAKAHTAELKEDGKSLDKNASDESKKNHERIAIAIGGASAGLEKVTPGWKLSRDSHYQLANRFAWAWKLASLGVPVVLVYLGFQQATEMKEHGEPFVDCADWVRVLLEHCSGIVPGRAWGRELKVGGTPIKPLIRVWAQELPENDHPSAVTN
jgi:hypothetical protein